MVVKYYTNGYDLMEDLYTGEHVSFSEEACEHIVEYCEYNNVTIGIDDIENNWKEDDVYSILDEFDWMFDEDELAEIDESGGDVDTVVEILGNNGTYAVAIDEDTILCEI